MAERKPPREKSKVRVLIVNHTLSQLDPLLGHQFTLAKAIGSEFENVFVFTSTKPEEEVVDFQYFVSSKRKSSTILRTFLMFKDLISVLGSFRPNLVFFHMAPRHCAIFSPILKILNVKSLLWYAHKSSPLSLILASKFVDKILTPTQGSISIKSTKILVTGHHIDADFYYRSPNPAIGKKILSIGRLDQSKRIQEIILSLIFLRKIGLELSCQFVGKPSSDADSRYMDCNYKQADLGGLKYKAEEIRDKVELRKEIYNSDVFVHASLGSLDKSPLEATIAGLPVASENPEIIRIFGSWAEKTPVKLSDEIQAIYGLDSKERVRLVKQRQEIALKLHSLSNWVLKFRSIAEDTQNTR